MENDSKVNGFTLIEVLISMIILSALIGLSIGAYRLVVAQSVEEGESNFEQIQRLINFEQLTAAIKGMQHYYALNPLGEEELMMQGNDKTMTFVTASPLGNYALAQAWLTAKVSVNDGLYQISYCERPLGEFNPLDPNRLESPCSRYEERRFIDGLAKVNFEYFGWPSRLDYFKSVSAYAGMLVSSPPRWQSDADAARQQIMPFYIRLNMADSDSGFSDIYFRISEENPFMARMFAGSMDE